MVPNPAIRNLIREDKVHQIYSSMQVGQAKYGMQTFNQALAMAGTAVLEPVRKLVVTCPLELQGDVLGDLGQATIGAAVVAQQAGVVLLLPAPCSAPPAPPATSGMPGWGSATATRCSSAPPSTARPHSWCSR